MTLTCLRVKLDRNPTVTRQSLSLEGAARSIIFVATNVLSRRTRVCRDKHTFVRTKDVFCRDKNQLVATKVLWPQNYLCRDKTNFVATNVYRDKYTFVATIPQTKIMLVAAPANDRILSW